MRGLALDGDVEAIRARHRRPAVHADEADVHHRHQVQAEDDLRRGVRERPVVEHAPRAGAAAVRVAFLGRLKQEHDRAGQVRAQAAEDVGDAERDRGMAVVAARVLHVRHGGLVWHVDELGQRQRVHVRAQGDDGPGPAALQHADDPGHPDARPNLVELQRAEPVGDNARGALFAETEFGVPMQVTTHGDSRGQKLGGQGVHARAERGGWGRRLGGERSGQREGKHTDRRALHDATIIPSWLDCVPRSSFAVWHSPSP